MPQKPPEGFRVRYGIMWPPAPDGKRLSDLDLEFACFLRGGTKRTSKYQHCVAIINAIWPHLVIHEFMERLLRAFCENNFTGITGCSGSGKSFTMAIWALISWWADPLHTMVFVISTTKLAAKGRIWKHILDLFQAKAVAMLGKLIRSTDKIALRDMPVKEGTGDGSEIILVAAGESDALEKLQGNHAPRVILLCDEGQSVDNAVENGLWNLKNNPYFEFRVAGNPSERHDFHGRFCEPDVPEKHGMDYENAKQWPILALGIYPGLCVHFNATDSPNYELQALGKPLLPYLPQPAAVAEDRRVLGRDDPRLWRQSIGVWMHGNSMRQTVFSDAEIAKFKIKEPVVLVSSKRGFGIDPSYTEGGDNFVVRPFDLGLDAEGQSRIVFHKPIIVPDAPYKEEDDTTYRGNFARAKRVRDLTEEHGVIAKYIGVDSTGANPFSDILDAELGVIPGSGDGVLRVEFGAAASEESVSLFDDRKSKEAYQDKGTELWFSLREFAEHDQLRGLDDVKTIKQLAGRKFIVGVRGKLKLEPKAKYKLRTGQSSPDEADSTAIGGEVARQRMGAIAGMAVIEVRQEIYRESAQRAAAVRPMGLRSTNSGIGGLRSTGGSLRLR